MIIPKHTLSKWLKLKEYGDFKQMELMAEDLTGRKIVRQTFARALELGRCNDSTYQVLEKHFESKIQ